MPVLKDEEEKMKHMKNAWSTAKYLDLKHIWDYPI